MLPSCRAALLVLATTVAATLSMVWEPRADGQLLLSAVGRQRLGWLVEPGGSVWPVLGLIVAALLVTRASWIGGIALPFAQGTASYFLVLLTAPTSRLLILVTIGLCLIGWAVWIGFTVVDWPFPTVPALYAGVPMAAVAGLLACSGGPTAPDAPEGVLLRTVLPIALALAGLVVVALRVIAGAQRELMRLEVAAGLLLPALLSTAVWVHGGTPQLIGYGLQLGLVGALLYAAHHLPRRFFRWAERESQNPFPRIL